MKRGGMTLVELTVGFGILAVLGTMMFQFQRTGWRRIQSTDNKLTAARATHEQAEALRRTLSTARWAWVVPPQKGDAAAADGSSALLYVSRSLKRARGVELAPERVIEHFHDDEGRRLVVDGKANRGILTAARFTQPRAHVVEMRLEADEHSAATGFNAERERSRLVTAVHLATEHENDEFAAFAYETDHPWCTRGRALHAGFIDP